MTRRSSLIRPSLKRYKKYFLMLMGFLLVTAYPVYLLSSDLSAHFIIEHQYSPNFEVNVDYDLYFKVYENINNDVNFTKKVVEKIDNAQKEIYVAIYSFNIEAIRDALVKASERGVKVIVYYHYSKSYKMDEFLGDAKDKLEVRYVARFQNDENYYNMHHKFMIVDPDLETRTLLTGPWNWSHYQEDLDPNILIETHDKEIIDSYMEETGRISRGFSGYFKFRDLTYLPWDKLINYPNGDFIEIWWSPGRNANSIEGRVIALIKEANNKIDISMTQFDSYQIAKWLIRQSKAGVKIRMIVNANTIEDEQSIVPWFKEKIKESNLNIEVFEGGTFPTEEKPRYSIFHHHNMIIDDKITFTSTANWTFGGFFANDENSMVISSKEITKDFQNIFDNYLNYLNNR